METKQTAIEWLQAIELHRYLTLADWTKAKKMERRQINEAAYDGYALEDE